MQLLAFADYTEPTARLAAELGVEWQSIRLHRFPDGEHNIRLPLPLPAHTVICRSLFDPNAKLVDLLLAARCAREHGAKRLTLIAPYLCYMRQDTAFQPGEAISQKIIGAFLAELFDAVITVDPHLHRTPSFAQAVPARHAVSLSAAAPIAAYLKQHASADAVLLGPDAESAPWVAAVARISGHAFATALKKRLGDHRVDITLPSTDVRGRNVWLVDDMLATGHTIAAAARQLIAAGARAVNCLVTHALCSEDAEGLLRAAGLQALVSSDSVPHASNRIHLAGLLAAAVRNL